MTALYARQSADRPDSISVESQIEYCMTEVHGDDYKIFTDRGFSGKNTDRPAFAEMMNSILSGSIHRVVVYRLDRISRSVLDFSTMMELFGKLGVDFVSCTEKFDTSSPMGRAMLNICVIFAQLERETIQLRAADSYISRSKKSFFMGGRIPYGFTAEKAVIDGHSAVRFAPVSGEAETVAAAYKSYAKSGASLRDTAEELNRAGLLHRGKPWQRSRVAELIRSPVYVRSDISVYEYFVARGVAASAPPEAYEDGCGCYLYKYGDGQKMLVPAPHIGIVDAELWLRCNTKGCSSRGSGQKSVTWLAGLLKCGLCGYAMTSHCGSGGTRYLICSRRSENGVCPGPKTVLLRDMEEKVADCIKKRLSSVSLPDANLAQELTRQRIHTARIEAEIESLISSLAGADAVSAEYINKRISALHRELLQKKESKSTEIHKNRSGLWDALTPPMKREAAGLLLSSVRIYPEKIELHWKI